MTGLPDAIEILRREVVGRVEYLILGLKLRRPVTLWFDKESGESWGSFRSRIEGRLPQSSR